MKLKFLSIVLAGVMITAFSMTSCLNDDIEQVTYTNETSITGFSLGTLWCEMVGIAQDGSDSLYMDTVSFEDYPFTIDQLNRTIENRDSLPVNVDISRVLVDISADTPYIIYGKIKEAGGEATDTLWTSTDSIDFSVAPAEGLSFKVLSMNGIYGREYHVKVNVHKQDPDLLTWSENESEVPFTAQTLIRQKAVYTNGRIYVFGQNGDTPCIEYTTVSANGKANGWTPVENVPANTNTYSAMVWQDKIYFLAGGELYELADDVPQLSADSPADIRLQQLLANATTTNGATYLYAYTEDNRCVTYDGTAWSEDTPDTALPSAGQRFSYAALPLSYNANIARTFLFGTHTDNAGTESGFMAHRLTNESTWNVYDYTQSDTLRCPNIADATMIYYDKKLYAFGGAINSAQHEDYQAPFSTFFASTDNGLTWKPVTEDVTFPSSSFAGKYEAGYALGEGSYSCVVDENNFIWIIWHDGTMSRGRINRLGFLPKW